jgi:N-hydroxyarylamine O-acetyltransferase
MSWLDRYQHHLQLEPLLPLERWVEALLFRHLETFAFANLEVLLNPTQVASLQPEAILEKLLTGRGGYCFEHNRLLHEALQSRGADVTLTMAKVTYGRQLDLPRTHRAVIWHHLGEKFLLDVGFGPYTPPVPVAFSRSDGRQFCVRSRPGDAQWSLWNGTQELYTFDEASYGEEDCQVAHFYSTCHPQARFRTVLMASRRQGQQVHFVHNRHFVQVGPQGREQRPIEEPKQLGQLLGQLGLRVSADEAVRLFEQTADFS